MQQSQFERLLKLAARTGDRLIVTDPTGKEPVVILPLAEYEGLLDASSFRQGREDRDIQKEPVQNVRESASEPMIESNVRSEETEGEFDPEALEEQVMAAMVIEEPEVIPVVQSATETTEEPPETSTEEPRKPIVRRPKPEGEEQFYLEPV